MLFGAIKAADGRAVSRPSGAIFLVAGPGRGGNKVGSCAQKHREVGSSPTRNQNAAYEICGVRSADIRGHGCGQQAINAGLSGENCAKEAGRVALGLAVIVIMNYVLSALAMPGQGPTNCHCIFCSVLGHY